MIATDINFPEGLPGPLREGHSLSPVQTFLRTQLQSGRARQRRNFSDVPTMGTWDFIFTSNEAAAFEAWFRDAINDGVDWFNINRLTPIGNASLVCRFAAMYTGPTLYGRDRWRYSCPIETYERPIMPPEWGILPEFILKADIFDIAMNYEWPLFMFDFETYQAALDAFDTLEDGTLITVRDVGGQHAEYRVRRNTGPSLSLDFSSQQYFVTDGPDALILVRTWG